MLLHLFLLHMGMKSACSAQLYSVNLVVLLFHAFVLFAKCFVQSCVWHILYCWFVFSMTFDLYPIMNNELIKLYQLTY